jgi:hypothetical protein
MRQCTDLKGFPSPSEGGGLWKKSTNYRRENNEQCCGSEMFIPEPDFYPDPGSRVKKAPDPGFGSATKNLSIFNTRNGY